MIDFRFYYWENLILLYFKDISYYLTLNNLLKMLLMMAICLYWKFVIFNTENAVKVLLFFSNL